MIVANIKSPADLQAKKDLQKQLIELEIANEAERQKRFEERGIREKEGKKLVEQYRTPAEIQKDKVSIEKKALDNLLELGFGYNEAGQLVNWLNTSNRLADFTTSFKLIKKDIQEGYDKTIVDSEFLKNYLDNFFDDLDANLGKKFSKDIGKNVDTGLDNIYGADPFKNLPDSGIISGIRRPRFSQEGEVESAEQLGQLGFSRFEPEIPTPVDLTFASSGTSDLDSQYEKSSIIGLLEQLEAFFHNIGNNLTAIEFKYKTQQILHLFKILDSILPPASVQQDVIQFLSQNERVRVVKNITRAINKITSIDNVVLRQIQTVLNNSIGQLKLDTPESIRTALSNLDRIYNVASRQLSGVVNKEKVDAVIKSYGEYLKVIETKSVDYQKRLDEYNARMREISEEVASQYALEKLMIDSAREGYIDEEGVEKYKLVDEKRGLIKESAGEVAVEKAVGKIQAIVRGRQTRKLTKAKAKKEIEKLASETSKSFVNNIFSQVLGNVEIPPDTSATELLQEYLGEASLAELPEEEISLDDEMRIDIERRVNDFVAELDKEIAGIINPETGRNLTYKEKLSKKTKALINVLKKLKHPNPSTLTNEEKIAEIKKLQFNRLKAMNPLDRSTRKLMRPDGFEGMKTGLGVVSKLKKHFKGDEKLLKKVLSALQDDSSSDEEENKELARHIKATDSIDKKIEKLVKGGDAQFLPKAQRDAFYSGMKKIGLGRGNLDANTFKFLGNKDKWHEAFSGVGFKATRIPVSKVGKGVKLENQENPTYRQFGKYVLHIPHLVNNNTANFKYPSLGSIPSIKPLTVSDDYKDLILDVLQTGKLNKKELERLPQSEIKHFERVAVGAGLVEQLGLKLGSTEEDKADSKRFELLRGEYLAGNNNQDLIKELRMLITKFINTGRIHKNEGLNLLLELSTL